MRCIQAFFALLAILVLSSSMRAPQTTATQVSPSNVAAASPIPDADGFYQESTGVIAPMLIRPFAVADLHDLFKQCGSRTVVISAVINTDGAAGVRETRQSANSTCESGAMDAIKRSGFKAGTLNDKPVPVVVCLSVSYPSQAGEALPSIQPCPEVVNIRTFDGQSVYSIGGAVKAPLPTLQPTADYTDEARRAKYQGICLVGLLIDTEGNPQNEHIVRALGMGLDAKALEAVRQWRFKPATLNGKPVPVLVTVEVDFRLRRRS